jgi:hypothetical protein
MADMNKRWKYVLAAIAISTIGLSALGFLESWRWLDINAQCSLAFGPHYDGMFFYSERLDADRPLTDFYNAEYNQCMRANGYDVRDPVRPEPYKPFWKAEIPEAGE